MTSSVDDAHSQRRNSDDRSHETCKQTIFDREPMKNQNANRIVCRLSSQRHVNNFSAPLMIVVDQCEL